MENVRLDDVLYTEITALSSAGDLLAETGDYENALTKFRQALHLVPPPATDWAVSLWLYASMGDICFLMNAYRAAREHFLKALQAPDGHKNAFIHLRLGEIFYETHVRDKAMDHLLKAYTLKGNEIFEAEHEKYFSFFQSNILI
jgi:tetratricopeptide (TPR) repeat protein